MRDFIVTLIVFGSIPFIFVRPHVGIMMWTWLSLMNPHRLTWGFAYEMPFAMVIGSVTIAAWLMSAERKSFPWSSISVMMLLFVLWTNITSVFAVLPDDAWQKTIQFDKVILMTFLTMVLMNTEKRLDALIWIAVGSIAFFAVKGGIFGFTTGLQGTVFGPPRTFIADNNALAMATVMIIPLMHYLAQISPNIWLRWGMRAGIGLALISVIGSYSRGAFVGLIAISAVWLWRSQRRILYLILMGAALLVAIPNIPDKWYDRIDTIENFEEDQSAMNRLGMWGFAIDVAKDRPIVGGGFGVFDDQRLYDIYRPETGGLRRSAHSIYFQILGSQGFVGLALFLLMWVAGIRAIGWIRKQTKGRSEFTKEYLFSSMCSVSIVAYAVCGAFQNLATWDFPYVILAAIFLTKIQVAQKLAADAPQETMHRNSAAEKITALQHPRNRRPPLPTFRT